MLSFLRVAGYIHGRGVLPWSSRKTLFYCKVTPLILEAFRERFLMSFFYWKKCILLGVCGCRGAGQGAAGSAGSSARGGSRTELLGGAWITSPCWSSDHPPTALQCRRATGSTATGPLTRRRLASSQPSRASSRLLRTPTPLFQGMLLHSHTRHIQAHIRSFSSRLLPHPLLWLADALHAGLAFWRTTSPAAGSCVR